MNNIQNFLSLTALVLFFACSALKNNSINEPSKILANIDLIDIKDDKVQISVSPSRVENDEIIFYIPQIVPGTYEYSNFGRFIENLKAFDKKGNLLPVESLDKNSWRIYKAKTLSKLTYMANDTFDGPDELLPPMVAVIFAI